MPIREAFFQASAREGWGELAQAEVLGEYIGHQGADDAYQAHLDEHADSDCSQIELMLDYIEAQQSDDCFLDHLAEHSAAE